MQLPLFAALTATAALFLGAPLAGAAEPAPTLPIEAALKLAQDHLKDRGISGHYIGSIALEVTTMSRAESYWYAKWVPSIPIESNKAELGLRINMDGSLLRLTSGGARTDVPTERRVGARNIR